LGDHPRRDVSVGNHPNKLLVVGYRERADVLLSHQSRGLDHRRRCSDRAGILGHRVANALRHRASSRLHYAILALLLSDRERRRAPPLRKRVFVLRRSVAGGVALPAWFT